MKQAAYIALTFVFCVTIPALAQDKVGQLSSVDGEVTITRAAGGQVETAVQRGPRVRNGSVFPGDIVQTASGASAQLSFSDGSTVDLKESTRITVEERDLSKLVAAGERTKPIGRRIKVLAGDILASVVPNPEIATEYETPSGVAAVKGTVLSISVGR